MLFMKVELNELNMTEPVKNIAPPKLAMLVLKMQFEMVTINVEFPEFIMSMEIAPPFIAPKPNNLDWHSMQTCSWN